jgi:DNA invertase Pin-like site-specific DNA recombinase
VIKLLVPQSGVVGLVGWYEDRGGKRSEAEDPRRRPDFQRLMADAQARKFDAIVVEEDTRFGTKDVYQFNHYAYLLREAGVELWEARNNKQLNPDPDQMGDVLTTSVRAMTSTQEVLDKSTRTLGTKLARASCGLWQGGLIPTCSAVECRTASGQLLWTVEEVDGQFQQTYPDGRIALRESFPTDRQIKGDLADQLRLVPSRDPARRHAVELAFTLYDQGIGTPTIARKLNSLGYRTGKGTPYYPNLIPGILQGSHFAGRVGYGKERKGKFFRRRVGQAKYERVKNLPREYLDRSQWLLGPETDEAIISWELWERVQARMDAKYNTRSHRNLDCWLSPVLVCGDCGNKMVAWLDRRQGLRYGCQTNKKGKGCKSSTARHDKLEALVYRYLEDTGQSLAALSEGEGLAPLYAQQVEARTKLGEIRLAIEAYLYGELTAYYPYREQNGYRIFQVELPDGSKSIRLPDFTGRHEAISWLLNELENAETAQSRAELQRAKEEHGRLYALFKTDLPPRLRDRLLEDISAKEEEIARLEGRLVRLGSQLVGALDELRELGKKIAETQELLRSQDAERKSAAIQQIIREIRCEWKPVMLGSQVQRRLSSVRIVPLVGDPSTYTDDTYPSGSPPRRPGCTASG